MVKCVFWCNIHPRIHFPPWVFSQRILLLRGFNETHFYGLSLIWKIMLYRHLKYLLIFGYIIHFLEWSKLCSSGYYNFLSWYDTTILWKGKKKTSRKLLKSVFISVMWFQIIFLLGTIESIFSLLWLNFFSYYYIVRILFS